MVKHETDSAGKSGGKRAKNRRSVEVAAPVPVAKSAAMRRALLVAAVIVFALCAYANSFHAGFLLDNDPILLKDVRIQEATSAHVRRIFSEEY